MQKIIKNLIIVISVISCCINLSFVLADNSDCGTFGARVYNDGGSEGFGVVNKTRGIDDYKYSKFLSVEQQLAIIDKESINTALLNLKKYCCENKLGGLNMELDTCKNAKEFFNDNIIDSKYLFDHLFDVIMRRLNGLTGDNDIYKNTNMSVDDKGLEWRERINGQAENVSGANPQIISDKYKEFWQQSSPQSGYDIAEKLSTTFRKSDEDFLSYVSGQGNSEDSEKVAQAFKNYEDWTMYDRYNNACAITQYLYALLNLGAKSEDKTRIINNLSQGACKQVIENQINNESLYVKLVTLQAGNLFLQNYMQGYLSYLYGRTQTLQKSWSDITDRFLDIVRGVPHLVNSCVK